MGQEQQPPATLSKREWYAIYIILGGAILGIIVGLGYLLSFLF